MGFFLNVCVSGSTLSAYKKKPVVVILHPRNGANFLHLQNFLLIGIYILPSLLFRGMHKSGRKKRREGTTSISGICIASARSLTDGRSFSTFFSELHSNKVCSSIVAQQLLESD